MIRPHFPFAIGLLGVVAPDVARASGLSVARFGGEHGNPMTTEATAIYYNPSGIADSEGGHVFGDVSVAFRGATYDHARSASDAGDPTSNTGHASLFNVIFEPFVGATYRLGHFAVGAAFYTPFGGQNSWSENDAFRGSTASPGAVDGVQRWYTIQGELRSSFFSAAGAYSFGPVSIGVSANLIDTVVNTVQARNTTGDNDVRNEGRAWLEAQGWDPSFGVGITVKPLPRNLRLGLSYQSRPGFGGGIRTTGVLHTAFASTRSDNDVAFTTDLPDVVRGGAAYRPLQTLELRLFGDYQRWSVLDHQCIMLASSSCAINADGSQVGSSVILNYVRNWHDTFGVRAGASYWATPAVELVAGAGYTSNAIPSTTLEPALLDFNAISASVGAVFSLYGRVHLGTTYTQLFYLPRDTTGQSEHPALAAPSKSP
ncbi:MAG TPA: outer membrane protein transport protein, partial [Polyangiaceae bacterium]